MSNVLDVSKSCARFVDALASTRLPAASNRRKLAEATLGDSRITQMLEDLSTRHGWVPSPEMRQIHAKQGPEDMLWLWCMHSLWADTGCADLLAATCRPGWPKKTNGDRFRTWLSYKNSKQRADLACFLGPADRPEHAVFCELAFVRGAPSRPESHKDYGKIVGLQTRMPTSHVLIDGTLSPSAEPRQMHFQLPSGERASYVVVTHT